MAREDPYFRLRIPDSLKAKVEAAATENRRSMTAEIIARLEGSFDSGAIALGERLDDHEQRLDDLWRDIDELKSAVSSLYRR